MSTGIQTDTEIRYLLQKNMYMVRQKHGSLDAAIRCAGWALAFAILACVLPTASFAEEHCEECVEVEIVLQANLRSVSVESRRFDAEVPLVVYPICCQDRQTVGEAADRVPGIRNLINGCGAVLRL